MHASRQRFCYVTLTTECFAQNHLKCYQSMHYTCSENEQHLEPSGCLRKNKTSLFLLLHKFCNVGWSPQHPCDIYSIIEALMQKNIWWLFCIRYFLNPLNHPWWAYNEVETVHFEFLIIKSSLSTITRYLPSSIFPILIMKAYTSRNENIYCLLTLQKNDKESTSNWMHATMHFQSKMIETINSLLQILLSILLWLTYL